MLRVFSVAVSSFSTASWRFVYSRNMKEQLDTMCEVVSSFWKQRLHIVSPEATPGINFVGRQLSFALDQKSQALKERVVRTDIK